MNSPASVAHVTNHRTISLLRQFKVDSVILITCKETAALASTVQDTPCEMCVCVCVFTWRPSSRDTLSSVMSGRLSMSVAILKASWASLKMCDAEWMFFWMDSNTVSSFRASPGETSRDREARSGLSFTLTLVTSLFTDQPDQSCVELLMMQTQHFVLLPLHNDNFPQAFIVKQRLEMLLLFRLKKLW